MVTITWSSVAILVLFGLAALCTIVSILCLHRSITAIGWYEISWAEKERLKGDSVIVFIVAVIFWCMLYIILNEQGYVTIIAGYMPIGITGNGIRIGY